MILDELKTARSVPLPLLFGTDWWTDCDDVAALHILLQAHRRGVIDLKAIGVNSVMPYSAPSVKALCEENGCGAIPIGLDTSAARKGVFCLYQKKLASFCSSGFSNKQCQEGFRLYRSVLATLPGKAVIVDVGFPPLLMELLQSQPDDNSALTGMQLVKEKVSEIVLMGGRWDRPSGREYNFFAYPRNRKAAAYLCAHCPVPLTFLGYEAGKDVLTGGKAVPGLTGTAYAAHRSPNGRPSWDPMTALYAIIGDAARAGYRTVHGKASVDPKSGKNSFLPDPGGPHAYLVKTKENGYYQTMINDILQLAAEEKNE